MNSHFSPQRDGENLGVNREVTERVLFFGSPGSSRYRCSAIRHPIHLSFVTSVTFVFRLLPFSVPPCLRASVVN